MGNAASAPGTRRRTSVSSDDPDSPPPHVYLPMIGSPTPPSEFDLTSSGGRGSPAADSPEADFRPAPYPGPSLGLHALVEDDESLSPAGVSSSAARLDEMGGPGALLVHRQTSWGSGLYSQLKGGLKRNSSSASLLSRSQRMRGTGAGSRGGGSGGTFLEARRTASVSSGLNLMNPSPPRSDQQSKLRRHSSRLDLFLDSAQHTTFSLCGLHFTMTASTLGNLLILAALLTIILVGGTVIVSLSGIPIYYPSPTAPAITPSTFHRSSLLRHQAAFHAIPVARSLEEGEALVEFGFPGLIVPLQSALNPNIVPEDWAFGVANLSRSDPVTSALLNQLQGPRALQAPSEVDLRKCPSAPARLFLGIATRCCDRQSQLKRQLIRDTWLKTVREQWSHVMAFKFIVAQPDPSRYEDGIELLTAEIAAHRDLVVVPGVDSYKNLPNKTLRLLQYGFAGHCNFTHILKIDDDIFFRPEKVLKAMSNPGNSTGLVTDPPPLNVSAPELQKTLSEALTAAGVPIDGEALFSIVQSRLNDTLIGHVKQPKAYVPYAYSPDDPSVQPQMERLLLGHRFNPRQAAFKPDRRLGAKWYLSKEDLPDEYVPQGVEYPLGWGYIMSRDVVGKSLELVRRYSADREHAPGWWARIPWEDVVIGVLAKEADAGPSLHHPAFKTAWEKCDNDTAIKHLDIEALAMIKPLNDLQTAGVWEHHSVPCSAGDFEEGQYYSWLAWRNNQSDVKVVGKYG